MIREIKTDVAVIGAGPAGLAAAAAASAAGAEVTVLERDPVPGGILNQCIHDGFGLYRYGRSMTGPEYAALAEREARSSGAEILCGTAVIGLERGRVLTAASRGGLLRVTAGAVVLASGCRERTRGALMIPGDRPAGIFTAGTVQELINLRGTRPGRRAVVLGSGDVGLIAARRMVLSGMEVAAICEAGAEPTGLTRNILRCAGAFGIPVLTRTTVSRVIGKKRLEAVELSDADENMHPVPGTARRVECDTLVLSVGLIPERELLSGLSGDTEKDGVFLCGNCKKIEQLADMASATGERIGKRAADFALGRSAAAPEAEAASPVLPTGFPKPGTFICTGCPRGCTVTAREDGSYRGNLCPRGAELAAVEAHRPGQTLTVSVPNGLGEMVFLRSAEPIPTPELKAAAEILLKGGLPGAKMLVTGKSPHRKLGR